MTVTEELRVEVAGENSLVAYFAREAGPRVAARVQRAAQRLPDLLGQNLLDLVPSYTSLLVIYDPLQTDHRAVRQAIREAARHLDDADTLSGRLVELPVYYAEESGPDLRALARRANLSPEEVIRLHQAQEYRVYAIGFAPGFAYLGQVDERIATPRLATPRQRVPRGAVAIADRQTAIYPAASPGGWNLIGLCPVRMFDPAAEPSMPVTVGDRVRFRAVDRATFLQLGGELPEPEITLERDA